MEKTTIGTYLYYKDKSAATSVEFTKLIDITSYPAIRPEPERLERSNMSDEYKHYEPGMKDLGEASFGVNYAKADYDRIVALEGKELIMQLRFGENGEYGAWQWEGTIRYNIGEGALNSIRSDTLSVYMTTDPADVTI